MTIQELQERYHFNRETPIVIGDRCKIFFGKLDEDEVIIISDLSPRIIEKEPVDSFEVGTTFSFEGTSDNADSYVYGSSQYTIRMLENYSDDVQNKVKEIMVEVDEDKLKQLEKELLYVLRLPELDRTQKLLDIKSLYSQGLYDETFKAIAYDYADDLLLDGDMLYLLGDMCEKGMGTFQNKEQARQFFARAAEVGITNATKRVEMIDAELESNQQVVVEKNEEVVKATRLKRKSGPVGNKKRGLSKKNQLRYSIIASLFFILGLFFSSIFSLFTSDEHEKPEEVVSSPTDTEIVTPQDVENEAAFKKVESAILAQMGQLKNYTEAIKRLKEGITLIEQSQRTMTLTPKQTARLEQLNGYIMGQISALNDNKKDLFWTKHSCVSGETVISIANHYHVPEKNVLDEKGKALNMDRILKNTEIVKIGIPALFFNHKVLPGESIGTISNKYDIQPADIRKLNDLSSDILQPGQDLRVYIRS
ncbi:LysM peptidoglycan-binding domain-containing protein [Flammeovirga kamogawensis]|uniref:LysM peptidoglycan-binding domain-containing protein n=1 Tax=Flammeovirga kamogawensis TaxID=373891 RepID=A0ABX8GXA0_9BACT|nr:LysM peptidoglycan-binding domain-containing protein [Flammeovirga kamogawensis]MBB6460874.1 LysM repeat protein [Flammeovirga kamogawensis]QWG08220.1 LysM peptidoglycan-binding domain-containing protein [Flammeovirga kamogawensis]TRX70023.1 LysM peptidoglycan-binding domain-containing protein [Flammeovirga kamogawensis]